MFSNKYWVSLKCLYLEMSYTSSHFLQEYFPCGNILVLHHWWKWHSFPWLQLTSNNPLRKGGISYVLSSSIIIFKAVLYMSYILTASLVKWLDMPKQHLYCAFLLLWLTFFLLHLLWYSLILGQNDISAPFNNEQTTIPLPTLTFLHCSYSSR